MAFAEQTNYSHSSFVGGLDVVVCSNAFRQCFPVRLSIASYRLREGRFKERMYFGGVRVPPWPSQHVFINVLGNVYKTTLPWIGGRRATLAPEHVFYNTLGMS